jgi:hypothetical protein
MTHFANDPLAELRARIAAVDAELLALVARRLELAREVGEAKRAAGLPGAIEKAALADRADAFVRLMDAGRGYFPDTLPAELDRPATHCPAPGRWLP